MPASRTAPLCGTRRLAPSRVSSAPVPAIASRGNRARVDRDPVGEVPMSGDDPAPDQRR